MPDVDPLRARFAATRPSLELADWAHVQERAAGISRRARRRQIGALAVAALGVLLVLPTPGLGQRLYDAITGAPARPALQRYLARFADLRSTGRFDIARARELVTASSARGPVTLFAARSANGGVCLGLYATWLRDPGVTCDRSEQPGRLAVGSVSRIDPHVVTIVGRAPAGSARVRLVTHGRAATSSPVVRSSFLEVVDPSALVAGAPAALVALSASGRVLDRTPLALARSLSPRCDQHTPGRIVRTLDIGIALHEATTASWRCYWAETGDGSVVGGIWLEPLHEQPFDPSHEPAIIPRTVSLPDGREALLGRAAVGATTAVVTYADGHAAQIPLVAGYLLVDLGPHAAEPGHRATGIDLLDRGGKRVAHVALARRP